jgi:hypothetical protein
VKRWLDFHALPHNIIMFMIGRVIGEIRLGGSKKGTATDTSRFLKARPVRPPEGMRLDKQQVPSGSHARHISACTRAVLGRLIAGTSSEADVALVVREFYAIALAYLRVSSSATRNLLSRMDLRMEDAAYDAIADLFAQGSDSSFPVLARWWKSLPPGARSSGDELFHAARKLVIGAVHQRFFQMYRDVDPHLSKIIRNIKLSLKRHPSVKRVVIGNESGLTHRSYSDGSHDRPPVPHELLLPEVFDAISPRATLRDMLGAIGEILHQRDGYRGYVTLVEAAVIIREIYQSESKLNHEPLVPETFSAEEIKSLVDRALNAVCQNTLVRYRQRAALTQKEIHALESALSEIFRQYYVDGAAERTNYAILKIYMPALTTALYKGKYRTILEYLVRNTKNLIRLWLQEQEY